MGKVLIVTIIVCLSEESDLEDSGTVFAWHEAMNLDPHSRVLIAFALPVLFVTGGCHSLHGTVTHDRYISPDGDWSVDFRDNKHGLSPRQAWDEVRGPSTVVRFPSEWGAFHRFDVTRLRPETISEFQQSDRSMWLTAYFNRLVFPIIKNELPDAEARDQAYLVGIRGGAFFTIVRFPKRSGGWTSWLDSAGKRHTEVLDDVRAFTVIVDPPFVIVTTVQVPPYMSKVSMPSMSPPEQLLSKEYAALLQDASIDFVERIRIEHAPYPSSPKVKLP